MKVNIVYDSRDELRPGYLNIISPLGIGSFGEIAESHVFGNADDLNAHIDESEAEEIVAHCLEVFHVDEAERALTHWVSRLRKGGKLVVSGTDISSLCHSFLRGKIGISEVNEKLFTRGRSVYTADNLSTALQTLGLQVILKRIENGRVTIVAHR